ncbi:MAG: diguanylate cyclase [Desulfuromonadaceae bacterium]|nr:diguanylate cyclase [Desulfuromonadaceae bacterium]
MPSSRQFRFPAFSVSQKISWGYLLVCLFSLAAVIYSLNALKDQTDLSRRLVRVDFQALTLAQEMIRNLLAQERIERQALVLKDGSLVELYNNRLNEYQNLQTALAEIPLDNRPEVLSKSNFREMSARMAALIEQKKWREAASLSEKELFPLRSNCLEVIRNLQQQLQEALDDSLKALPEKSRQAYRTTLILLFSGLLLASLIAGRLLYKFHQSLQLLTLATRQLSDGNYDVVPPLNSRDEFGQLAREFSIMAQKLKELEQVNLDASPLTHLPGNRRIEKELQRRVDLGISFANIYIDLDDFKVYNDRYGFQAGSNVIYHMGQIIQQAVTELGNSDDLVGHIGGDDYVVLSTPDRTEEIARRIIAEFDRTIADFYSEKDRKAGSVSSADRFGTLRVYPIMTVSIACVMSGNLKHPSPQAISRECAKLKKHLKGLPGSNFMIDRRWHR